MTWHQGTGPVKKGDGKGGFYSLDRHKVLFLNPFGRGLWGKVPMAWDVLIRRTSGMGHIF